MTCRLYFVFAILCFASIVVTGPVDENSRDISKNIKDLERPEICSLKPDTGLCRASMRRYYYDVEKENCLTFTYGGCRGNENRFDTLSSCIETCGGN